MCAFDILSHRVVVPILKMHFCQLFSSSLLKLSNIPLIFRDSSFRNFKIYSAEPGRLRSASACLQNRHGMVLKEVKCDDKLYLPFLFECGFEIIIFYNISRSK